MLPGLGSAVPLPAGMERGFAGLLPLRAQSPDSHKGRMWGKFAQCILQVLRGKREPPEQIPAAVHSLHTHPPCPASSLGAGKPLALALGLSPKMLRCPLPQASAGGIPRRWVHRLLRMEPHPLPLHECPGCAGGGRGRGGADTLAGESHSRKRHQINQADSFRSDSAPKKGAPLWGARRPSQPSTCPAARAAGSGASGSSWPGRRPRRLPRVPARP